MKLLPNFELVFISELRPSGDFIQGTNALHLVGGTQLQVVLQVGSDAGQGMFEVDLVLLQQPGRADAGNL